MILNKNIHILPTDNKWSRLYFNINDKEYQICENEKTSTILKPNRHICITNSEEIKEGEYGLSKLNEIIKFHSGYDYRYYAKIILTTDQSLNGVQAIDDEFLEWFVKNASCEEVDVVDDWNSPRIDAYEYKIIIPKDEPKQRLEKYSERFDNDKSPIGNPETWGKREFVGNTSKWNIEDFEEPKQETPQLGTKEFYDLASVYFGGNPKQREMFLMNNTTVIDTRNHKQETLEEASFRLYPVNNTGSMFMASRDELNNSLKQEGFIEGYKLAQERSYSEEEVLEMMRITRRNEDWTVSQLFEQFKKKSL